MQENDFDMEEFLGQMESDEEERRAKDQSILMDIVKPLVSEDEFNDILEILHDCDITYDYSIEDEPKGDYQEEDYDFVKCAWVNQTTNGGYNGDEFAGTVSIKLPNEKYFQFYYSM